MTHRMIDDNQYMIVFSLRCSLAIQTAIQPWSATVYNHILQQGLQPALTFMPLPDALCGGGRSTIGTSSIGTGSDALSGTESVSSSFTDAASALFGDIRVHYEARMVLIGYINSRTKKLFLNPQDSSRLHAGDMLVALRRGHGAPHGATSSAATSCPYN
jgi:hypothetical protein